MKKVHIKGRKRVGGPRRPVKQLDSEFGILRELWASDLAGEAKGLSDEEFRTWVTARLASLYAHHIAQLHSRVRLPRRRKSA